jgi:hypothetical protein
MAPPPPVRPRAQGGEEELQALGVELVVDELLAVAAGVEGIPL